MSANAPRSAGAGNLSPDMQKCIEECLNCHSVCLASVQYCLQMGGRHAAPEHIGILLDCAEICQTSANFMLRTSESHGRICGICAEVCARCEESCRQMGGDAQMQACAEACRRCANSCRQMASMMP